MSPSIYIGCSIRDDIAEALQEVNKTFKEIEDEGAAAIVNLEAELEKINGSTKLQAEKIIGSTVDNQVLWQAKEAGRSGNSISISYIYEGPIYSGDVLTGTLSVSNGIPNIAGVGTAFTTELAEGDAIRIIDSIGVPRTYVVSNIISDVSIILVATYDGATESGLTGYVDIRRRLPTSVVVGTNITLSLAVSSNGEIDPSYNMSTTLAAWLTSTDVANLVDGSLVGSGVGLPEIVPATLLEGGQGTPLKDAEEAANNIAKQFGHNTYQSLMTAIDIPVIETAADAAAYLEEVDDEIVIINKKLFIVEGTNLVGLRQLYLLLDRNVVKMREYLNMMTKRSDLPHLMLTENMEIQNYAEVCGEIVAVFSIKEVFRAYNEALTVTANKYTAGDISKLNGYIFWITEANPTEASYNKLSIWGYDDLLITYIIDGATPEVEESEFAGYAKLPVVSVIEDADLFTKLKFTDSEIVELLEKDIDGIKLPSKDDPDSKKNKLADLLREDREYLPNGMKSKAKKALATAQAVDLSKTGGDVDLSKEMATRGRGCARQLKNMRTSLESPLREIGNYSDGAIQKVPNYLSGNIKNDGLPNMPSTDLPNVANKVESAFGALSSIVNSASRIFDKLVNGIITTTSPVLNTIQNILSVADNLINNDMTKCLLGAASAATGKSVIPSLGASSVTIGGIPIPMSILAAALNELSSLVDETITAAFEAMMKVVEKPLCIVMSIMDDILGFDLGAAINPCKLGTNPNDECNPEDVQDTINMSSELNTVYNSLAQASLYPVDAEITEVEESIEDFTGDVLKTTTTTTQSISRGIKEVMEDITKSVEAKVDFLNEFDKAIKKLLGEDANEMALKANESLVAQESCAPTSIGALTDAITGFI